MAQITEQSPRTADKLQKGLITLTNQLLKAFKVSKIIYIVVKLLEHLQLIYFMMRAINGYQWDYFFFVFFNTLLKLISLETLFRTNPDTFQPILYTACTILVIVLVLIIVISLKTGWRVRVSFIVKHFISFVCAFLYLFKTVLIIPLLNITITAIIPNIAQGFNIPTSSLVTMLGVILGITLVIFQIYILVFFRDANPFSQLPYAGETFLKGLLWFSLKTILVLYSLFDINGKYSFQSTICITIIFLVLIIYSHYEIGLYKTYYQEVQLKFIYLCFTFGLLHSIDYNGQEISTLTYLVPLNILAYLTCQWIKSWKIRKILTTRFIMIQEFKQLEEHVLYLIQLIDSIYRRQNKNALEGYIQYHRRQCKIGKECPCSKIYFLKEESDATIKLESFKLVTTLLNESKRIFPQENRIDLLLGLLFHYRIKNSLQAVYAITKMANGKEKSTLDRISKSFYLQRIQRQMIEMDEKQVSQTAQINKYFEYTNKLVKFQNNIVDCTKHHIQFWRLVMDSNPDIRHLEDLGTKITRSKDQLKTQFDSIVAVNHNSIHLLTVYGKFLLEVTNEETYNVKYIQKAETIFKNIKESSKIDQALTKYEENAKTAVVIISGNDQNLGIVVHTNNLVKDLIGYKRSELLEKNVYVIMPKIYGETHNEVLRRYVGSSENKVNGHQRVVPALTKDGHMLPVTALTKVLPSLIDGIQIVAFIAGFQQVREEDDSTRQTHFLLYRSDTEQIVGVSSGCQSQFNISPSLIYGNPLNVGNQLLVRHLFGVSIQKQDEGKIVAALQIGEVLLTLNTKLLKHQFVINQNQNYSGMMEMQEEQKSFDGVQIEVGVKQLLSSVYNGTPLRLLAIYVHEKFNKSNIADIIKRKGRHQKSEKSIKIINNQLLESIAIDGSKTEGDDFKNLKDFKNFISIKRQPSAITALSTICILFILILSGAIIGLIFNYLELITINKNAISLQKLTIKSEIVLPELLSQFNQELFAYQLALNNTPGFTSPNAINVTINQHISLAKSWQLNSLPLKYFFDEGYNTTTGQYILISSGNIQKGQSFQEKVIDDYITRLQSLLSSNMISLVGMNSTAGLQSNIYHDFNTIQMNMLYSIRNALNQSGTLNQQWYNSKISQRRVLIIIVNSIMMAVTILWVILLLPYILSVTKINNRVLSLFTLISSNQISKLIFSCLTFMNQNLNEATVNQEDLQLYQHSQKKAFFQDAVVQTGNMSPVSPSPMSSLYIEQTHGQMMRGHNKQTLQTENFYQVQQKFEKMINSQDRNKKIIIFKFVLIALVILSFVLFYLFFSLSFADKAQKNVKNYFLVGKRPAMIRNLKLLLTEYLANPIYQPNGFSSISTLNQNFISQFYILQGNLLQIDLGTNTELYNQYNNGDCCSSVSSYSSMSLFKDTLTTAECVSLNSGVFQKGLKTGVVSILQDLRAIISNYPTSVPQNIHISKLLEYNILIRYVQTPMLAVLNSIQSTINSQIQLSRLIIVMSGSMFIIIVLICWKVVWSSYLSELNIKIWRTKGLLNLIPMRIITANEQLKSQFTSGQLEKAVR